MKIEPFWVEVNNTKEFNVVRDFMASKGVGMNNTYIKNQSRRRLNE